MLVFEDLYSTAPASLRSVRLASRQFNVLVDPIVYRHLKLNKAVVNCFDVNEEFKLAHKFVGARDRVRSAICTFTRQITIDEALDWSLVVNILLSLDGFHQLNWSVWETDGVYVYSRPIQVLQSILSHLVERWPSAKLSVNNLSLDTRNTKVFMSLPAMNLDSLRLRGAVRAHSNLLDRTHKTFLLQCDQLNILHLLNLSSGTRFLDEEIEQSERLPPIEQLYLQGYEWLHSPGIATSFWNWPKLTSLRLEKVFIVNFIESVSPENLLKLRSLITDGHCETSLDHTKVSVLPCDVAPVVASL